jgi:hypothetical protein
MPQARGGGGSRSTGRSTSGSARAKRSTSRSGSTAKRTTAAKRTTRSTASRSTASKSTTRRRPAQRKASAGSAEAQLEAVAQRVRKLNERIITAGKDAGETTLTNYEKALKAIASAVERGPGSSDIDWISNVANAQAKFIRDVTVAMASAARDRLK